MIDLHLHSTCSDGTNTPEELVKMAEQAGLTAIALTDHNTIAGLDSFLKAGQTSPVETIPGIEITTDYNGKELHIVGLYLKPEHNKDLQTLLEEPTKRKIQSNLDLIKKLNEQGYSLSWKEIAAKSTGTVNRANIAKELKQKGYVPTIQEAFDTLLNPKTGLYTPPERLKTLQVIQTLSQMNAIPTLAHPLLNLTKEELEQLLPKAKQHGLQAMETDYSLYTAEQTDWSRKTADKHHLHKSGGSDYHGTNKPDIQIGTGKGTLQVPDTYLKELKTNQKAL